MNIEYTVKNSDLNINQILSEKLKISTRLKNKLIRNNRILKNGQPVDTRIFPTNGDIIKILLDYPEDNSNILPCKMNLDILFEDEHLLIVNKPSGIAVHPSILHFEDTLSNGIKFYYEKKGLSKKIRPVNRLDLNTSGIVVFAKNEYIQECLIKQMQLDVFRKEYIALVCGNFKESSGTINAPIARKDNSIIERCVSSSGQEAITLYEVLKQPATIDDFMKYRNSMVDFENPLKSNAANYNSKTSMQKNTRDYSYDFSLVKCILKTGRTHQIRVHMSHIGHPLVGDSLYGNESKYISGQALHCFKIEFVHPVTNELLTIFSK